MSAAGSAAAPPQELRYHLTISAPPVTDSVVKEWTRRGKVDDTFLDSLRELKAESVSLVERETGRVALVVLVVPAPAELTRIVTLFRGLGCATVNAELCHSLSSWDDHGAKAATAGASKAVPVPKFASLAEMGYGYNRNGELRMLAKGKEREKFAWWNQQHYDQLGDFCVREIQTLMQSPPHNLQRTELPLKASSPTEPRCPVFSYPAILDHDVASDVLVLLICGSGVVQAGQWARSLCVNQSLATGSILPYLTELRKRRLPVLVLNPNCNSVPDRSDPTGIQKLPIRGHGDSTEHVLSVWDELVAHHPAKHLIIIAHSYGGVNTTQLLRQRPAVLSRLRAVAWTDSVHSEVPESDAPSKAARAFLASHARNWVRSEKPLDSDEGIARGSPARSAGTKVHEETSEFCRVPLFAFLDAKLVEAGVSPSLLADVAAAAR